MHSRREQVFKIVELPESGPHPRSLCGLRAQFFVPPPPHLKSWIRPCYTYCFSSGTDVHLGCCIIFCLCSWIATSCPSSTLFLKSDWSRYIFFFLQLQTIANLGNYGGKKAFQIGQSNWFAATQNY